MDLQLNAKRALVTGSSAGIGEGIARTLAVFCMLDNLTYYVKYVNYVNFTITDDACETGLS